MALSPTAETAVKFHPADKALNRPVHGGCSGLRFARIAGF